MKWEEVVCRTSSFSCSHFKKGANLKIVKDSKKIVFFKERQELSKEIKIKSYFSIGISSVKEIEKLNILQASLLSMKRAIQLLPLNRKKIL